MKSVIGRWSLVVGTCGKVPALLLAASCIFNAAGSAQNPPQGGQDRSIQEMEKQDPGIRKARAALDHMIQALGGPAFMNIQDMEQVGRSYAFHHGTPSGGSYFWRFWKWPDKARDELSKQRDVIFIYNGDKGWEVTYKGTKDMDPDQLKEYLRSRDHSLNVVLREWLKQPGTELFYEGIGLTQDKQVDKVSIINAKDDAVTFFIDQLTHLPVKKSYQVRDPVSRELDEEAEVYDNWHTVQGIKTPYTVIGMRNNDMTRQRFIQSVTYNQGIPDAKFVASETTLPTAKKK